MKKVKTSKEFNILLINDSSSKNNKKTITE